MPLGFCKIFGHNGISAFQMMLRMKNKYNLTFKSYPEEGE